MLRERLADFADGLTLHRPVEAYLSAITGATRRHARLVEGEPGNLGAAFGVDALPVVRGPVIVGVETR